MTEGRTDLPSLAPPGIMLGIGLGGFFDGIVLHQIFQTHAMLSAVIPMDSMMNMKANMLADGLFHALMWMATLSGVALLWRALNGRRGASAPGWRLIGYMLAGWGWFNLIEGLIDHHLLNLHHVIEALGVSIWDWLFLASGIVLILAGHAIARKSSQIT
ncbi:membrane protein [Sphingobium sp. TomMM35A]